MIKARMEVGGKPMVLLGISAENVTRLVAGEPILLDLEELGLPPMQVVIMYGKTERHITAELERHGLLPPGSASDMAEPQPSRKVAGEE